MARLSLSLLLLLSLLSVSLARFVPESVDLLPRPDTETEPAFIPQLPQPESESESEPVFLPELPKLESETASVPDLPNPEPEEKPETARSVEYILVPVHRFADVRELENLQDFGFSLRLPIRHGHHHHHHRFGGFGHRFGHRLGHRMGHRFRHGFGHRFGGWEYEMDKAPAVVNGDEDQKMEMTVPEMPLPMQMKDHMQEKFEKFVNSDKTEVPLEEDNEKMERMKAIMKKLRKCKHHRMERGMHRHHEHAPEQREEPREESEEGGILKQVWDFFNRV